MIKFEKVKRFADAELALPTRATAKSAGYDFSVAETTVIPSYQKQIDNIIKKAEKENKNIEDLSLKEIAELTKGCRPTLVPTGIKCQLEEGTYLELAIRSSSPLKYWLVLANSVGRLLF